MAFDHRPSILFPMILAGAACVGFLTWDRIQNSELPGQDRYRIQASVQTSSTSAPAQAGSLLSAVIGGGGAEIKKDADWREKIQTKEEFVEAFKSLLMSNITMDDAKSCARVVKNRDICGAWDKTDNMLQSDRALAGQDIVALVSPHYISCLRAKKQEMIDGFVDGASSYNIQERNILVAKAVCLTQAASAVTQEAHAR